MVQTQLHWADFYRAISRLELEGDTRFNTLNAIVKNGDIIIKILDKIFAKRTLEEWEKALRENNCIFYRVWKPEDVINDPQALSNDCFIEIQHPQAGKKRLVATPVTFQSEPIKVNSTAPDVGQHTEELLLELGYNWEQITVLKGQGVII